MKNIHGSQIIQQALSDQKLLPALWLNDKSDLDSLDSDYFKHSLHQLDGRSSQSPHRERVIIETNGNCGQHKSDIIIETNYSNDNVSIRSDGPEDCIPDYCTIQADEVHVIENYASAENVSVLHADCQLNGNSSYAVNSGTLTIRHDSRRECASDGEADNDGGHRGDNGESNDRKIKFKEDHRSVISYDSIYLSSEGSNEAATLNEDEEKINEYLSDNNYSTLSEYTNIKRDNPSAAPAGATLSHQHETDKSDLDLYSQIHKNKPKILQLEAKTKLTTFSDISSRGTLERLTFVSSPAPVHKEHSKTEKLQHSREPTIENQYCSLPFADISKSLQASERIDAKLRQSCNPFEEQNQIYDSITNFGRAHKKLRQRECFDHVLLSPTPPEEKPKELACIDVKPNIKEVTPDCSRYGTIETPSKLLKIDEEISSLISAELTDIDNCSSKDCQIDEIRQNPEKIKLVEKPKSKSHTTTKLTKADVHDSRDNIIEETIDVPVVKINTNPVRQKSYQKSHHSKRQQTGSGKASGEHKERSSGNSKNNSSNTLKRRIENKTKHNLNEKPISKFVRNIDKSKNNKNAKVQQAILANINTIAQPNFNMSRPQILTVIDSKRQQLPRTSSTTTRQKAKDPEVENVSSEATAQAHKEFQHKVDSVRNYWSKLIDDTDDGKDNEKYTFAGGVGTVVPKTLALSQRTNKMTKPKPTIAIVDTPDEIEVRPATITASDNTLKRGATASAYMRSLLRVNERDELNSFTPSVEIVELDDQKQATIVKVQDMDAQDFDHVRYKVMKSDTFQKNILAPSRKEAQFDGLLQYLNEYSFQVSLASLFRCNLISNGNCVAPSAGTADPKQCGNYRTDSHENRANIEQIARFTEFSV